LQGMYPSDLFGNYYLAPIDRLLDEQGIPSAVMSTTSMYSSRALKPQIMCFVNSRRPFEIMI
jgi:lysyl-tRNA synthetase class I